MKTDTKTGRVLADDLLGHRFDRLRVVCKIGRSGRGHIIWACQCECGKFVWRRADSLKAGQNQSCGCLQREINATTQKRLKTTHGYSHSPIASTWYAMMTRCFNKKSKDFRRYGKRGRTVCEFLRASPFNLIVLIGSKPAGKSIDRIDNSGSYTCGTCKECLEKNWKFNIRWATPKEQANNH
jgi:hypothetical protein